MIIWISIHFLNVKLNYTSYFHSTWLIAMWFSQTDTANLMCKPQQLNMYKCLPFIISVRISLEKWVNGGGGGGSFWGGIFCTVNSLCNFSKDFFGKMSQWGGKILQFKKKLSFEIKKDWNLFCFFCQISSKVSLGLRCWMQLLLLKCSFYGNLRVKNPRGKFEKN